MASYETESHQFKIGEPIPAETLRRHVHIVARAPRRVFQLRVLGKRARLPVVRVKERDPKSRGRSSSWSGAGALSPPSVLDVLGAREASTMERTMDMVMLLWHRMWPHSMTYPLIS